MPFPILNFPISDYMVHWLEGENVMNEPKKSKPQTKTGQVPRIDLSSLPGDPPQPPTIPEVPDPGSTTGIMHVMGEGEDLAKHQDDSASSGQVDAKQPKR
jgi:hypothetical protein